jgi:hypothetical protein
VADVLAVAGHPVPGHLLPAWVLVGYNARAQSHECPKRSVQESNAAAINRPTEIVVRLPEFSANKVPNVTRMPVLLTNSMHKGIELFNERAPFIVVALPKIEKRWKRDLVGRQR